jgi:hypothetical protein
LADALNNKPGDDTQSFQFSIGGAFWIKGFWQGNYCEENYKNHITSGYFVSILGLGGVQNRSREYK